MEKFLIIVHFLIFPVGNGNEEVITYVIEQEVQEKSYCHNMARDLFLYAKITDTMRIEAQCIKYLNLEIR